MSQIDQEYNVENVENGVRISGVLRLLTPSEYEPIFKPIQDELEKSNGSFTLDIAGLTFLNSSGVTAIAQLVLFARKLNKPITILGSNDVPWQNKTMSSLAKLWDQITISFN